MHSQWNPTMLSGLSEKNKHNFCIEPSTPPPHHTCPKKTGLGFLALTYVFWSFEPWNLLLNFNTLFALISLLDLQIEICKKIFQKMFPIPFFSVNRPFYATFGSQTFVSGDSFYSKYTPSSENFELNNLRKRVSNGW